MNGGHGNAPERCANPFEASNADQRPKPRSATGQEKLDPCMMTVAGAFSKRFPEDSGDFSKTSRKGAVALQCASYVGF
jgi:hypothetical protein